MQALSIERHNPSPKPKKNGARPGTPELGPGRPADAPVPSEARHISRQGRVNASDASCLCFGQTLLQDVTSFRLFAQVGTQLLALLLHVLRSPDQLRSKLKA